LVARGKWGESSKSFVDPEPKNQEYPKSDSGIATLV